MTNPAFSEMPNLSSRIVCTSKIGNLSVQVTVPPGVGSGFGRFYVLGGGCEPQVYWTIERCWLEKECLALRGAPIRF